jgi:hypothetical protein
LDLEAFSDDSLRKIEAVGVEGKLDGFEYGMKIEQERLEAGNLINSCHLHLQLMRR